MLNTENYSEKMHNINASTISSTFKNNFSRSKNTSSQLTKTININKGNINYNSGNFKIPLFSSKNTKK